jgi:hypothetical protein
VAIAAGRHSMYGASSTSGGLVIGEFAWCCGVADIDGSRPEEDAEGRD